MRLVILHYHFFKNAGTTIEEILERSFGHRFTRLESSSTNRDGHLPNRELVWYLQSNPHLDVVSSHQIRHPVPTSPGFLFFDLCFLRDPVDRIRSMYDYFRKKPADDDPVSGLARSAGIGDFTAQLIEQFPWMVNDVQVNLLANGIVNDQPLETDLAPAIERMLKTSFLGVVDRFDESLLAGKHALRMAFPELDCEYEPLNVSGGLRGTLTERIEEFREACGERVYADLLRLNAMDIELLERARAEVGRRYQRVDRTTTLGTGDSAPRWKRMTALENEDSRPELPKLPGFPFIWNRAFRLGESVLKGHPLFDADFYARKYPDAAPDPLRDYLKRGAASGRQPHPLFDSAFYLRRYPEIGRAGMNPLVHYVLHGAAEGRKPHPLFDAWYYARQHIKFLNGGGNPLLHFLKSDPATCANPHPLFDCQAYRNEHPAARDGNPLMHYVLCECEQRRCNAAASPDQCVELEISDVKLKIVCAGNEAEAGLNDVPERGNLAVLWRDAEERARWLASAPQRAFVESIHPDQIWALFDSCAETGSSLLAAP